MSPACRYQAVRHRCDEAGVVPPLAQLVDARRVGNGGDGAVDVFPILSAAAVGTEQAGREGDGAAHAVGCHPLHRVLQKRVPVAVAQIHRQAQSRPAQRLFQRPNESPRVAIDGADAAEVLVARRDPRLGFGRGPSSTQHVVEERQHVAWPFGAAEGNHQHGVVALRGGVEQLAWRPQGV